MKTQIKTLNYLCEPKRITIMDLEARKYEFIQKLFNVNESLFNKLETIINKELKESNEFYTTDAKDLQERTKASLQAIEKGETKSIETFKKEVDNWKNQKAI